MEDELYIVKEKSVLYSVAQSQLTHFRMSFWSVKGRSQSLHAKLEITSSNFKTSVTVDYVVCS